MILLVSLQPQQYPLPRKRGGGDGAAAPNKSQVKSDCLIVITKRVLSAHSSNAAVKQEASGIEVLIDNFLGRPAHHSLTGNEVVQRNGRS